MVWIASAAFFALDSAPVKRSFVLAAELILVGWILSISGYHEYKLSRNGGLFLGKLRHHQTVMSKDLATLASAIAGKIECIL